MRILLAFPPGILTAFCVSGFHPVAKMALRQGTFLFATNVTPPSAATPDFFFIAKEETKPKPQTTKDPTILRSDDDTPEATASLSSNDSLIRTKNQIAKDTLRVSNKLDANLFKFNKFLIDTVYDIICMVYPVTGSDRDYARFFVLETVARVPYFAYLSVLHLRETFGERGLEEKMRTHYAEADNELHHLLIMEYLGGNKHLFDRNLAHLVAFGYYWYVVVVYMLSEEAAYHLSELIEDHAYNTYDRFLKEQEGMLKAKPVPPVAKKYYMEDNPYMFDTFCTVQDKDADGNYSLRRPELTNLYDVFLCIRDDEKEHWKALCNLVQYSDIHGTDAKHVKSTEPLKA